MAVNVLGIVFLAIGFLAGMIGLGLMYFSVEDEGRNQDGWFFSDAERTDENIQRHEAGRIVFIGGIITATVGAILAAVGRPD